ncbi:diguanylate cyclase [Fusibacter paucivorans]|uniref:Diguanylate cyclase n=1 Tax=Fusibacter paucivorans TaxID=76009 RepID=A0ABS5PQC0_9FIRM|nr:diguanylate cyclase [Fusibacter paucivorans]MBS7527363.1 diguanylate cyclase [Fusibacter paucivorans]
MPKNRQISINIILILVMIISAMIQYKSTYNDRLEKIDIQVDYTLQAVENKIVQPLEQLEIIRLQMISFLEESGDKGMPDTVNVGTSYYINPASMPIESSLTGMLEGASMATQTAVEVNAAIKLNAAFKKVIESTPEIKWIYYTSKNRFLNIYPFVDYDSYHVTPETFEYDFFRIISPEENPDRVQKWTKLYNDQVTGERMITISLPVYVDDTYYGALSIDYTLNQLSETLEIQSDTLENYALFNDFGEVVAISYNSFSSDAFTLNTEMLKTLIGSDGHEIVSEGYLMKTVRVGDQPLFLTSILDREEMQFYVLRQLYPIMFFILAALVIVNLYYRATTINNQLLKSEHQFKTLFNQSPQMIMILDKRGIIVDINRFGLNFMKMKREQAIDEAFYEMSCWPNRETAETAVKMQIETTIQNGVYQGEYKMRHHSGKLKDILYTMVPLDEYDSKMMKVVVLGIDVTEQKDLQYQLESMTRTDNLTQALNRRGMMNVLEQNINRTERTGNGFAVLICDIDFFKQVNDTYGHECGDEILVKLVQVMERHLRPYDHIGRWGGEEFLIVLENVDRDLGYDVADRLRVAIGTNPFRCSAVTEPIFINVTIGMQYYDLTIDVKQNIVNADTALYYGKRHGKNQTICFEETVIRDEAENDRKQS